VPKFKIVASPEAFSKLCHDWAYLVFVEGEDGEALGDLPIETRQEVIDAMIAEKTPLVIEHIG